MRHKPFSQVTQDPSPQPRNPSPLKPQSLDPERAGDVRWATCDGRRATRGAMCDFPRAHKTEKRVSQSRDVIWCDVMWGYLPVRRPAGKRWGHSIL